MRNWVESAVLLVLTFILWFCAMLILRLTPLTGPVFLLASFGLTFFLGALGWSVLTLWIRLSPRRSR